MPKAMKEACFLFSESGTEGSRWAMPEDGFVTEDGHWKHEDLQCLKEGYDFTVVPLGSEETPKGGWFHLYRDCFDEEDELVYLELGVVPSEASTSVDPSDDGLYLRGKGSLAFAIRQSRYAEENLSAADGRHKESVGDLLV